MSDSGSVELSEADGSLFSRSPSIEETRGKARWRASEPPEEVFGDGEWQFQIIGEEVDYQGNVRYEVEWEDWERADGSNTTWESPESISDIKWRPAQQRIRNEAASKSLSMDVLKTTDIHMTDTYLRKQAFKEKLKRYTKQRSTNSVDEMAKLLMKHQEHVYLSGAVRTQASQSAQGSQGSSSSSFPLRTNQRARTRQQTEISLAGSSRSTLEGSSSRPSSLSATLTPGDISSRSTRHPSPSHRNQTFAKSASQNSSQMAAHDYLPLVPRPTSTPSLKGKEKEVDCSPFTRTSNLPHHSAQIEHEILPSPLSLLPSTPSLQGKRKTVYTYSSRDRDSEQSTSTSSHKREVLSSPLTVLSSPPRFQGKKRKESHTPSSPQRMGSEESESTLSPSKTPRKRLRRIVKSGSEDDEDEDEGHRVSPLPSTKYRANSSSKKLMEAPTRNNLGHRRERVQHAWTALARNVNAAPIYLVNDIDDDDLPDLDPSFDYLESTYKFSADVERPSEDFLISCSCRRCNDASICECQHPSELIDAATGVPFFAYQFGLFDFNVPRGTEVIECNKLCGCSEKPHRCPNRVSQQPRMFPIEIFKTKKCGWGVRSPQPIKRGQVLGLYTGLVITREEANTLPDDLARYRFDLDGDDDLAAEGQPEPDPSRRTYSVDSRLHGNWTRFINHSCSPNLQVYLAVHNTPPGIGLPYIVFVANKNIPIREEFSFDYNPSKSSTIIADSEGDPCLCGSSQCRHFY